ncbi:polyamine aminopropyltransferase [Rhodospirillaceae bacterium SYSU D60014]|uniref:polyamine aminopropyltransferase n=1 Tax=Virgifigura deserti TaxID=2268457 RepID=UPI000E67544A
MTWFEERIAPGAFLKLQAERTLYSGQSDFQDLAVFETAAFGRVLALDGVVQTTERDEFIYHEMLTHLPLFAHGAARRVLIIGGGDGGMLEEALKHPVERVTLVELDPKVVEVSRQWLPSICGGAFDDPRTDLVIGDGAAFVAETDARYDLVIVDSPDPIGPATVLFSHPFYENCQRCLSPGGILVTQNGVPFLHEDEVTGTHRHLHRLFPQTGFYLAPVPTYTGGFMAFGWASERNLAEPPSDLEARIAAAGLPLAYYNPGIHRAAFALPEYVRKLLD